MRDNFISCMLWVAKGVSKSVPDEVKLLPEELKELIEKTKEDIKDIEPDFEDEEDLDCGSDDDKTSVKKEDGEDDLNDNFEDDEKNEDTKDKVEDSDEDINSKYDLDNYDDSDDERAGMKITDVTMYVDNKDDDYMVNSESDDEDKKEEEENFRIKDDDNLLVVGHVEGDSCIIEVYVYNKAEDDFYVHHQMDLAAFPVALEWMDFHPSEEESRGSYVAVGDMTPVISVWDLDVVGDVPDYTLGKKLSKKKLKKSNLIGHKEAVISLSWNKKLRNILASGSADNTIILWNLSNCKGEKVLKYHTGNVQTLEWDPFDSHFLLSGCTDGLIRIYDHRADDEEAVHSWEVKGEIERVCWNKSESSKFLCSTDNGFVYGFDMNNSEYEFCIKAHEDNVTVLDISPDYPNLLMTGGYDQFIKVWDLNQTSKQKNKDMKPVYSTKTVVAKIYAARFAPDSELVVAVGGHCSSNNLKIMDLGELKPGVEIEESCFPESNEADDPAESASDSQKSQIKKKKKKKHKNFQPHEQSAFQNAYSAGPSCSEENTNFVQKKKKRKFNPIN